MDSQFKLFAFENLGKSHELFSCGIILIRNAGQHYLKLKFNEISILVHICN